MKRLLKIFKRLKGEGSQKTYTESQCPLNDPPPQAYIPTQDDQSRLLDERLPPVSPLIGSKVTYAGDGGPVDGKIVSVSEEHVGVDWVDGRSVKYHKKHHKAFIDGILLCLMLLFMGCDSTATRACLKSCGIAQSRMIFDDADREYNCHCRTDKGWIQNGVKTGGVK